MSENGLKSVSGLVPWGRRALGTCSQALENAFQLEDCHRGDRSPTATAAQLSTETCSGESRGAQRQALGCDLRKHQTCGLAPLCRSV